MNGGILTLSLGVRWQSWLCWWSGTQAPWYPLRNAAFGREEKVYGYTGRVSTEKFLMYKVELCKANDSFLNWSAAIKLIFT